MLPLFEARYAVLVGFAFHLKFHDMPWAPTFALAVAGNLLAAFAFYLLLGPVSRGLVRFKAGRWVVGRLYARARRRQDTIDRHGVWGLTVFVAIPLPMTGAWTGALLAHVLGLSWLRSVIALTLGVLIATGLLTLASYGGVEALGWLLR